MSYFKDCGWTRGELVKADRSEVGEAAHGKEDFVLVFVRVDYYEPLSAKLEEFEKTICNIYCRYNMALSLL